MDDLSEKLDRLLSSPNSMKRIEELMGVFTGGDETAPPPPIDAAPLPDLGMMLKLAPLLAQFGQEDDSAALLQALRPHLQHERQKRLDEARQMMRLVKLLPLLGELKKGDPDT